MTKTTNIVIAAAVVVLVIVGFIFAYRASNVPSKYQPFAQELKDSGVRFYGAFWCPHCQAQEKQFNMSRQKLEKVGLYVECSPSTGQGQTQICVDAKIESYPTWVYSKEFSVTTPTAPTLCEVQPGPTGQPASCVSSGSKFFKSWIFPISGGLTVQSVADPKNVGDVWTFAAGSRTTGEIELTDLATFSGVPLPVEPTATK